MKVPVIVVLLFLFLLDALITFSIGAVIWWLFQRPPVQVFLKEVAEYITEEERKEKERRSLC